MSVETFIINSHIITSYLERNLKALKGKLARTKKGRFEMAVKTKKTPKAKEVAEKTYSTKTVSNEEIVRAWATSSSSKDAAEKLGMDPKKLAPRVAHLRKSGVNLKKFRTRGSINADELNELYESFDEE